MAGVTSAAPAAAAPSLRQRLTRFVLLLALSWVVLASVVLALWVRQEVYELLDDGLVASSEALAVVLRLQPSLAPGAGAAGAATAPVGNAPASTGSVNGETPFAWQLVDAQGQVLLRSPNAPGPALATRLVPGLADGVGGWRVHVRPLDEGRWLLVGQGAGERSEDTLEVVVGTITVALVVSGIGLVGLRWRLARETLPLADLAQVLGRYNPLKPGAVLPPPALRELAPVHEAVQELGRRLAEHAAAERAFSAHAAHALRTPLAGLDAQLAVAQREAPSAELQARLQRMRGATGRLSRVVGALLALFRSSGELRRAPVDVAALLERVPLEGLAVEVEADAAPGAAYGAGAGAGVGAGPGARPASRAAAPAVQPEADADLLAAALINLLDNAVRHGAHRVRVRVAPHHVTLLDDGPGVTPERLEHLRQALAREEVGAGAPEQAITGLGLVLADRVARAHGGRLELLDAEAGFAVRLWLVAPFAERVVDRSADPSAESATPGTAAAPATAPGKAPTAGPNTAHA